jgi:uncharacterized protein YneF (UPF0154 family)
MEEKKKDKSTKIIIVLLVIIIILLVAGYVVLFIMKDKLLEKNPPIVKTTTTTVETTEGEKTTEPTTKKVEELKDINDAYTDKLNAKVSVALSADEKKYGVYHKLFVTGTKQEDIKAVMQFFIGDASFEKMIDLRIEYRLYDPETENFEELLNQEASSILDSFSNALSIHELDDEKTKEKNYLMVINYSWYDVPGYDFIIFDKGFNKIKTIDADIETAFSEKSKGNAISHKWILKNQYYELKANKFYYFANKTCSVNNKGYLGTIDLMYISVESGKIKETKEKTYKYGDTDDNDAELQGHGASC